MTHEPVAGNGLLDRRLFLCGGVALAGNGVAAPYTLTVPSWSRGPGSPFEAYGTPSRFEADVARLIADRPAAPGVGSARTPLHRLDGMITPNGLHFERSHSGVPEIEPQAHRLVIHGRVARSLVFDMDALLRYPMESRILFIECSGNSGVLSSELPAQAGVQEIHGLVSCAEWTGVRLGTLLDEAGVGADARWLVAEGADAATMTRSVPLAKARDDALVALYQNGERLRPSNGYPVRLVLPGYEGNMQVKWLRRIKLVQHPAMTRDETSKYTLLRPDGRASQFVFPMRVKSVIVRPSPEVPLRSPGLYEISGLAWSGDGKIRSVDVSADGGRSWAPAALQRPVLAQAMTRFRIPWRWSGGPSVLQSRATDDHGNVQPTRSRYVAQWGVGRQYYHWNVIQSWRVDAHGAVRNVYA